MNANKLKLLKRLGVKYVAPVGARSVSAPAEGPLPASASAVEVPAAITAPVVHGIVPGIVKAGPQADAMTALYQSIHECQKCPLGKTRLHFVFGSGDPAAEIVFVGEAPGADEDEQGLPFVGRAGQLLTKIIESTKTWKREEVFICNVLKCRPPGNRTPQPEEVEICRPYLEAQLKIIHPKLIVAMGASAAHALLKTKEAVGKLRGNWHDLDGVPLRVTYHPAALLRDPSYKRGVWDDMKIITSRYQELKTQ